MFSFLPHPPLKRTSEEVFFRRRAEKSCKHERKIVEKGLNFRRLFSLTLFVRLVSWHWFMTKVILLTNLLWMNLSQLIIHFVCFNYQWLRARWNRIIFFEMRKFRSKLMNPWNVHGYHPDQHQIHTIVKSPRLFCFLSPSSRFSSSMIPMLTIGQFILSLSPLSHKHKVGKFNFHLFPSRRKISIARLLLITLCCPQREC